MLIIIIGEVTLQHNEITQVDDRLNLAVQLEITVYNAMLTIQCLLYCKLIDLRI